MTYLDTSVAMAHILAEDRQPPENLWGETLVTSRLLHYELWNRIHARGLTASHSEAVKSLIDRIATLELSPPVLSRALDPFPAPVRTFDALHLATLDFLCQQGQRPSLASYDDRMNRAALAMGIELYDLSIDDDED